MSTVAIRPRKRLPHNIRESDVRRCRICRKPVGYFAPTGRDEWTPFGAQPGRMFVPMARQGRSRSDYRCIEHEVTS